MHEAASYFSLLRIAESLLRNVKRFEVSFWLCIRQVDNFSNLGPVLQMPDVFDSKNIQNIRVDSQSQISLNNIYKSYNIETLRIFDYCSGMPNDNVSVLQ